MPSQPRGHPLLSPRVPLNLRRTVRQPFCASLPQSNTSTRSRTYSAPMSRRRLISPPCSEPTGFCRLDHLKPESPTLSWSSFRRQHPALPPTSSTQTVATSLFLVSPLMRGLPTVRVHEKPSLSLGGFSFVVRLRRRK